MHFIGDVHGKMAAYYDLIKDLPASVRLGDMGLGFSLDRDAAYDPGPTHRFIRGNHDNPDVCRNQMTYMGDYGYDTEGDFLFVSGTWSIDWKLRTPFVNWWPDEQLSMVQFERALALHEKEKPHLVVSHDCPMSVMGNVLSPGHRPKRTITVTALDMILEAHAPEMWIFAHHHRSAVFEIGRTQFIALDELEVFEAE